MSKVIWVIFPKSQHIFATGVTREIGSGKVMKEPSTATVFGVLLGDFYDNSQRTRDSL